VTRTTRPAKQTLTRTAERLHIKLRVAEAPPYFSGYPLLAAVEWKRCGNHGVVLDGEGYGSKILKRTGFVK
jgi:hypothetical protein